MSVATKNLFDVLGNDVVDDTPIPEPKLVEKTSTHTTKRNTDGLAPSKGPVVTGNRRGGASMTGNEAAFRDRNAGRETNRGKSTEEPRGGRRGGFRGRGGRREEGDRHPSKAAPHSNSEKQAAQSWGANEGNAELKDEQAGEEIAQTEKKEAAEGQAAAEGEAKEEEPEENHISYDQYLAQLAEKKLALEAEAALSVRKPNEGVKDDKWKDFAPIQKGEEEELFPAAGGKATRQRERKAKQFVELENRFIEERPQGGRGGRGGPRGGARGDGAPRGARGDRGDRGDGPPRGARGDGARGRGRGAPRGGEPRGDFRGGRGGRAQESKPINTKDESAFPSLGGN